ncbi:unnamed protein product, partial [Phaeothamnion confervicola]
DSVSDDVKVRVTYAGNREVEEGERLMPPQVHGMPTLRLEGTRRGEKYTLLMVDPDAPSPQDPVAAEWLHWMVVNMPGEGEGTG